MSWVLHVMRLRVMERGEPLVSLLLVQSVRRSQTRLCLLYTRTHARMSMHALCLTVLRFSGVLLSTPTQRSSVSTRYTLLLAVLLCASMSAELFFALHYPYLKRSKVVEFEGGI